MMIKLILGVTRCVLACFLVVYLSPVCGGLLRMEFWRHVNSTLFLPMCAAMSLVAGSYILQK